MSAALAACSGGGSKATQVAVKVNKDEVTVLQVNEGLAQIPSVTQEDLDPATRRVVRSLINQQLLVQQAIEHKLDRDPQILGALEAARLSILARAYVSRVITPQAKPSEQEVRQYYTDNPALFAERKVYRVQELSVEAKPDQEKQVLEYANSGKSLKQVADYLHEHKIAFSFDGGVRTAEQLPLSHLTQIAQLKAGSALAMPSGAGRVKVLEVVFSQPQPVDDKNAAPVIEQYLTNRKRDELAAAEVKKLRAEAKIEYVGDYAKYEKEPPPEVAGAKPAPAPATGEPDKGIAALR